MELCSTHFCTMATNLKPHAAANCCSLARHFRISFRLRHAIVACVVFFTAPLLRRAKNTKNKRTFFREAPKKHTA